MYLFNKILIYIVLTSLPGILMASTSFSWGTILTVEQDEHGTAVTIRLEIDNYKNRQGDIVKVLLRPNHRIILDGKPSDAATACTPGRTVTMVKDLVYISSAFKDPAVTETVASDSALWVIKLPQAIDTSATGLGKRKISGKPMPLQSGLHLLLHRRSDGTVHGFITSPSGRMTFWPYFDADLSGLTATGDRIHGSLTTRIAWPDHLIRAAFQLPEPIDLAITLDAKAHAGVISGHYTCTDGTAVIKTKLSGEQRPSIAHSTQRRFWFHVQMPGLSKGGQIYGSLPIGPDGWAEGTVLNLKGHRMGSISATGGATDKGFTLNLSFAHASANTSTLTLNGTPCGNYILGTVSGTWYGKTVVGRFRSGWTGTNCAPIEGLSHPWASIRPLP